ncbi:MAG: hypothetical protein IJU66_09465 [Oscillospiraceae bacterium]|nr:hypothetical protein [Oscillospiraceae bacterium]
MGRNARFFPSFLLSASYRNSAKPYWDKMENKQQWCIDAVTRGGRTVPIFRRGKWAF